MKIAVGRTGMTACILALALTVAGCSEAGENSPEHIPQASDSGSSTSSSQAASTTSETTVRDDRAQAFLDELAKFGLPTGVSADTTVEVGIGICQNIAGGASTDTILNYIRPLSSAIAAQSENHDTDEVGRAIVEASRTHLCD